jgi:predicted HAD superfamily hydrolase
VHFIYPRQLIEMFKPGSKLERKIENAEVISLDVFDTAVLRTLDEPRSLFELMVPQISGILGDKARDFPAARFVAEGLARKRAWEGDVFKEARLAEIYAVMGEMLGLDAAVLDRLCECEIQAELSVCRQNPFVHSIYRRGLELGKSIVFLSDMYLPEASVGKILSKCGYSKYHALLVSSETRRTKMLGDLYDDALKRITVPPRKWLHIGDNPRADVKMARRRGIATWHSPSCAERFKKDRHRFEGWRGDRPLSAAGYVVKGLVTNRLARVPSLGEATEPRTDFWADFGYTSAGPLYVGFTEWLFAQVAKRELNAIYFLARDGYIVQQLFERYRPAPLAGVETHYLYASRRALNLAALEKPDERGLGFLMQSYVLNPVGIYLQRIGLDLEQYAGDIRRAGFDSARQVVKTPRDQENLEKLLVSLWEPIRKRALVERSITLDYLLKSGLGNGRSVALVDIGWQGSQQRAIQELLQSNGHVPPVIGFYLGTFRFADHLIGSKQPNLAYLFNCGQPREYETLIFSSIEILELLFSAAEGSLIRIERTAAGEFVPIKQPIDADDASRNEILKQLQAGALQFADDYFALKQDFPELVIDPEVAITQLRRVLRNPTAEEAKSLGEIAHTKDFGESTRGPVARASSLLFLLQRRRYIRLREGTWRAGIEARSSWLYRALYRLRMGD